MIQHGVSFQIVPQVGSPDEYYVYANVDTWQDKKCIGVKSIMALQVTMANPPREAPDNMLWVLDMLEVASQMIQREITPQPQASFTPANDRWRDTTEKPFLS